MFRNFRLPSRLFLHQDFFIAFISYSIIQSRHAVLIVLTIVYLLGQACTAWGWFVFSSIWLSGFLLVTALSFYFFSRSFTLALTCLFSTFVIANITFQRVIDPHLPSEHLRYLALPQEVTLEGWLFREPDRFPHRGRLYLETLRIWRDGAFHSATGKIQLNVRSLTGSWRYGDTLRTTLRLRAPRNFHTPGSFDYEGYLARQGIYVTAFLWDDAAIERLGWQGWPLWGLVEDARRTIGTFFSAHLDEQTAAVLSALIIGDEGHISKNLRTAFSRAGVAHVLSISGLHISLVAAVAYGVWWWLLGRSRYLLLHFVMPKLAALLTIPLVLLYASLAGGNVATWRSVVMVLVYLFAIVVDRQNEVYRSLALAALLVSLFWPGSILDISFQLSFLSVLSIVLGMEQFFGWWERWRQQYQPPFPRRQERLLRWLSMYLAVSVYALLGTAPLTAFHFNQISVIGIIANLVVVPLLGSSAVLLGLLAAFTVFLNSGLATGVVLCAGIVTKVGIWLTQVIGSWTFAAFDVVTPTLLELGLLYGCLVCLLFSFDSSRIHIGIVARYFLALFAIILVIDSLFWVQHRYFHQDLRVSFLDVGQGDAAVVELPGSQVMVIDGGGFASEEFDVGEAILAPFLWSRKIGSVDILVMSHPQLDHYGGLRFLAEHFSARELWSNGERSSVERFTQLWTALERNGVTLRQLCQEKPPIILSAVQIQILHPPCAPSLLNTNNASLVLRLSHGALHFLFTGDVEAEGEQLLLAQNNSVGSEILKAPHHGSLTSSTPAFVGAVAPQLVVTSVGYHNRFGFPAAKIVQRYEALGARFLRTDLHGAVSIVSDGRTYSVRVTTEPSVSP